MQNIFEEKMTTKETMKQNTQKKFSVDTKTPNYKTQSTQTIVDQPNVFHWKYKDFNAITVPETSGVQKYLEVHPKTT